MNSLFKLGLSALLCAAILTLAACNCNKINVNTNTGDGATANLTINGLGALGGKQAQYVSVSFTGNVVTKGDGSGAASFTVTQEFEIDPSGNITPGTTLPRVNLQPGSWSVTATVNSWTAACTGTLSKGGSGNFVFTYNTSGCSTK
jgi:hypothetical protein